MTTALDIRRPILCEPDALFPRSDGNELAAILERHARLARQIDTVAGFASGTIHDEVLQLFFRGNYREQDGRGVAHAVADRLFQRDGAMKALDASCWAEALAATDVYQVMNQDRRNAWDKQIREHNVPPFTGENLHATLGDLLAQRSKFFAERVDGLFRALSGEHVTNAPQGFGKRMILAYVTNEWGHVGRDRVGYISDLRAVVAKFMGRQEPNWYSTSAIVENARRDRRGEWVEIDGGALRLRCYLKGTAHLEVHPDMAWRLNAVLHSLHPRAIAAEHRERPKKPAKEWKAIRRPVPVEVLNVLSELRNSDHRGLAWSFYYGTDTAGHVYKEARAILEDFGGTVERLDVRFEYDFRRALSELIASGCLPDQVSHQYYWTPARVADLAVAAAGIQAGQTVLEPSAGQGALAEAVLRATGIRPTCVELSEVHCEVLRAKGFDAGCGDFLAWSKSDARRFDRVVMNPPFNSGRWQAHLEAAAGMVTDAGRLVSVLPASSKGKDVLPGWSVSWSMPIPGEFADTNVSVVILTAQRSAEETAA